MMSHVDDISVDRFEKILEGASKISNLEHGFQSYIKKVLVSQTIPKTNVLDTMKSVLPMVSKDSLHCYLNLCLSHVTHQKNLHWVQCLLEMLIVMVKEAQIPAKPVCDAAVKVLDVRNEMICCQLLKMIKAIIGSVDYKGCRDLLISLLDNIDGLPPELPLTCRKALATVQQTVSYILDRNASVLPAYLAGIELQKRYHHIQKTKAHWVVHEEVERCIESLKGIANMISGGGYVLLLPILGVSSLHGLSWRLNPDILTLPLKGLLPYKKVYLEPHIGLLRHLMLQPQSWDLLWTVGGFIKQQKNPHVEELLADLAVLCMKVSEACHNPEFESNTREFHIWNHFSAQLFHFCFFQTISFGPVMVHILDKLLNLNLTKGRDYLMWSIYQYLSSNSQTKAQINFFRDYPPLINLMDLLYADKEPLAVPDVTKRSAIYKLAASSLWVYLARKASNEKAYLPRPTPFVLQPQVEYLNKMVQGPPMIPNFSAVLFFNAFSPVYELANNTMTMFADRCYGPTGGLSSLLEPCCTIGPTVPLPLTILESFTAHAKFSVITKLRQHIVKVAETPSSAETLKQCLPPALLECYARFLSFPEVEWVGFKTFLTQVIYGVVKVRSWHTLNGLLELVSFRVHQHIPQGFRFKLIGNFLMVASSGNIPSQLYISIETAALRLIARASTTDLHIQIAQYSNDPKQLLSQDSEECNKALVLTVAHTLHITGVESTADNWLECFIKNVYNSTPHIWSAVTQAHFPNSMQHCYSTVASGYNPTDHKRILITRVEDEYRKWRGTINEPDLMRSYQETDAAKYCLCVLWRGFMETGQANPVLLRVLERLPAKSMAAQLRLLADYFVYEMSNCNPQLVNTAVVKLSDLVWKYNLFTLDRLILTMTLRWFDNKDLQTCFKVIHMLLLATGEFINRVKTFLKECSPFHWEHDDYYQKHMAYLRQYPEKFNFSISGMQSSLNYLPVYFGNVCLRLLPVLDLVVHRMLELTKELSNAAKSLEKLLEHIGGLYKFHDYPVTYLYTTLHYYERLLSDKHAVKKMLVYTILGARSDYYPLSSFFTTEFCKYLSSLDGIGFQLNLQHCNTLLSKLVEGLSGSLVFHDCTIDWRFFEFRSAATFSLFTVAVECLTIPAAGSTIGGLLLDSLLTRIVNASAADELGLWEWINSLAILLTNLPESYRLPMFDQVLHTLKNDFYIPSQFSIASIHQIAGSRTGGLMGLLHAYWQHSNIGTLSAMPQWIRSQVRPIIQTEHQFIYFCHLVGPLFQRVHTEKPRLLVELVMEIYSILQMIDQHNPFMTHTDLICDLLYHIKYAYMGDVNKDEIEKIVSKLHSTLQTRLRFLASGSSEHPSAVHLSTSMNLVNQQPNITVV